MQIIVAPPYETCASLHGDDAAALRVKKVVSLSRGGIAPLAGLACRFISCWQACKVLLPPRLLLVNLLLSAAGFRPPHVPAAGGGAQAVASRGMTAVLEGLACQPNL